MEALKGRMSTYKLLNLIGLVSIVSVLLYFMAYAHEYSKNKVITITGLIFYFVAALLYFLFGYLYHKSKTGQTIVLCGLAIITIFLLFILK